MRYLLIAILVVAVSAACAASPCGGVDRSLTNKRKSALAPAVAKQLHAEGADILQSFRVGDWSIIYVDTHQSDEAFLFYANDPLNSNYITIWSGAAAGNEEQEITDWTLKNAPSIPPRLSSCFAWYVTKGRN